MNAAASTGRVGEAPGSDALELPEHLTALAVRLHGEYREMPGLRLTVRQAARLFGTGQDVAETLLDHLRRSRILALATDGAYALISEPSRRVLAVDRPAGGERRQQPGITPAANGSGRPGRLSEAPNERLASLLRHWTWADEALARFERELAKGWAYDDRMAIHPFGAYAHWCALLCAFAEGALEGSLLPPRHLDALRTDLEASVSTLRSCRELLTSIPPSLDEPPRVADLIHDETLPRLRRIHRAFGEALHQEHAARGASRGGVERTGVATAAQASAPGAERRSARQGG